MAEAAMQALRRRLVCEKAIRHRHREMTDFELYEHLGHAALEARKTQLEQDFANFKATHRKVINVLDADEIEVAADLQEEVSQQYFAAIEILNSQIALKAPSTQAHNDTLNTTFGTSNGIIRVEAARAPEPGKFDGKATNWPAFRDRFKAEVYDREQLDDVTKLLYLQDACIGAAKQTLGDWQPIAANFEKAWESLEHKYEDSYRLEQSLINKLLSVPRANEESLTSLRQLIDIPTNTLRQLEAMKVKVQEWDPIIIGLLVHRLPRTTADAWEQKRDVSRKPILQDLLTFLEGRARGRIYIENQPSYLRNNDHPNRNEHFHRNRNNNQFNRNRNDQHGSTNSNNRPSTGFRQDDSRHRPYNRGSISINNEFNRNNASSSNAQKSNSGQFALTAPNACMECGHDHALSKCPDFQSKPRDYCEKKVKEWDVCKCCFRKHAGVCRWGDCYQCPGEKHNRLLCLKRTATVNQRQPANNGQNRPSKQQQS